MRQEREKLKQEDPKAFDEVNKKAKRIADSLNKLEGDLSVEEMREKEFSDGNYVPPSFDPRDADEIEANYQLLLRKVEFMQGQFFWKCLTFSGIHYKPIFDLELFTPPRVD